MKRMNWKKVVELLGAPHYYFGADYPHAKPKEGLVINLPAGEFDSIESALQNPATEIIFNGNVVKGRGEL